MVSAAFRGVIALIAAVAISFPASAHFGPMSSWLRAVPQPSALGVFLIAVAGVLVGRFASRTRREP